MLSHGLPAHGDGFGTAVDVEGSWVVVGAPYEDASGTDSGSAYTFFDFGGSWIGTQDIVSSNVVAGDRFGHAVSLSGERLLIGAPGVDRLGGGSGLAFVYRKNATWQQEYVVDSFTQSNAVANSVSLSGTSAIIGVAEAPSPPGSAWIFDKNVQNFWLLAKQILLQGGSVALEGDFAALGLFNGDGAVPSSGVLHTRGRVNGNWYVVKTIFASDGIFGQNFGWDVAASSSCVIVGAPFNGNVGAAAYVYCGFPPPLTQINMDVACCIQLPTGSAPAQLTASYENASRSVIQIMRSIVLLRPDGVSEAVAPSEPIDVAPGATAQEEFTPFGEYRITAEWEDENGVHREIALFTRAARVPALGARAIALLGLGLAALVLANLVRRRVFA